MKRSYVKFGNIFTLRGRLSEDILRGLLSYLACISMNQKLIKCLRRSHAYELNDDEIKFQNRSSEFTDIRVLISLIATNVKETWWIFVYLVDNNVANESAFWIDDVDFDMIYHCWMNETLIYEIKKKQKIINSLVFTNCKNKYFI